MATKDDLFPDLIPRLFSSFVKIKLFTQSSTQSKNPIEILLS